MFVEEMNRRYRQEMAANLQQAPAAEEAATWEEAAGAAVPVKSPLIVSRSSFCWILKRGFPDLSFRRPKADR